MSTALKACGHSNFKVLRLFNSLQEEIIHGFSKIILGGSTLFCPDNYGNSKEPADLVWISNRAIILMYMTKSNGTFEKCKSHNLKQLRKWLKIWRNGRTLQGKVGNQIFNIAFGDVDYIIGLSIVDCPDPFIQYHEDEVLSFRSSHKLSICATLSSSVVKMLSELGYQPRDIIAFLSRIKKENVTSTFKAMDILRETHASVVYEYPHVNQINYEYAFHSLREVFAFCSWTKSTEFESAEIQEVGSDLKFADIIWLAMTTCVLESSIPSPGETGHLFQASMRETGKYTLTCIAAASMQYVASNLPRLEQHLQRPGLTFIVAFDFGKNCPTRSLVTQKRNGRSHIEEEISTLF